MLTLHTFAEDNLVENYFESWRNYDNDLLSKIFACDSKYEINPINRTLMGIKEICHYWNKNKNRQEGISVEWSYLNIKQDYRAVNFCAQFYDNEDEEYQKIEGIIHFTINDNEILNLSEKYTKKGIKR